MFQQLYTLVLIVTWLFTRFHISFGNYLVEPVVCTDASINLRYSQPLPAAGSAPITVTATDSGVWKTCQLGALGTAISYYLTLTADKATCEQATFTNFVFTGFFNCTTLYELPARAKNLTVPLSDPNTNRYLNEVQPFLGPIVVPFSISLPCLPKIDTPFSIKVPGFQSLYAVNFTFIFPEEYHRRDSCGPVISEKVTIIPQLFLINVPTYSGGLLIPPIVGQCR